MTDHPRTIPDFRFAPLTCAYHESGHAVVALSFGQWDAISRVAKVPAAACELSGIELEAHSWDFCPV
jgi:hypothetical protein